ncbi:MAG: lysylphosphatidylglycerol synthase transmembrane domain-containing protein [Sulfitobacter sp.]
MTRWLNIAVSLAVVGALIWWAEPEAILEHLQGASIGWLALAGISLTTLTFLMAKRWQIVAAALEIEISYPRAVGEYYITQMVNLMLPGGVVGDISRAVRVRHEGDLIRAAQSVAADRIAGQVVMFATLGVALAAALLVPAGIAWSIYSWIGIVLAGVFIIVALILARRENATGRFVAFILHLLRDTRLMLLNLVIMVILIFSLYACARATGTVIPPAGWFTLIPLILSAMLIPLSVGGWGWREGAAAALFPLIGASPSAGIAMGIAYGAMMMITAIPGLYFAMGATASSAKTSQTHMETL